MPEVRATASFYDMGEKRARNIGDEFFCEDDRAAQLSAYGMVEILGAGKAAEEPIQEPTEEPSEVPAEEPKPKPRKTSKKESE